MKRTFSLLSLLWVCAGQPALALAAPVRIPPAKSAASAGAGASSQATAALSRPNELVVEPARSSVAKGRGKAKPCYAKPVQLLRVRGVDVEPREVSLTLCNGAPNPAALDSVSVLGRPRDVERPLLPEIRAYRARPVAPTGKAAKLAKNKQKKYRDPLYLTENVMRLNPGLLVRLQKVAKHYPGKVIEIISGYRPDARLTSRHHHGQALDLRVAGVTRERLRDYLRTFEDTGVGYYPNSFFVHMDVRDAKGYWVDRSGPGEPADYGPWPAAPATRVNTAAKLAKQDAADKSARDSVLKGALADLDALRAPLARSSDKRTAMNGAAVASAVSKGGKRPSTSASGEPAQENDEMSQGEVQRAREEARKALEDL
jgi:hypothetical protein